MGADACSSVIGNSTNDRYGCFDSDGDGYSNKDDNWGYSDGADGYPDDPTRWGPPPSSDGASFQTVAVAGGGIIIIIIIGLLLFLRGRSSHKQFSQLGANNQAQQQGYVNYQQPAVMQQNYQTVAQNQPAAHPQIAQDPARDYYQNLINQGYPHEHAVAYTQQYFPGFSG